MHQISLTAFFNVLSILCVCVVVHVYMRGTALHIFWCIPHYLKFINAAEHLAAWESKM